MNSAKKIWKLETNEYKHNNCSSTESRQKQSNFRQFESEESEEEPSNDSPNNERNLVIFDEIPN